MEAKLKEIESVMTDHPDFPKPGILSKNIMPIFSDAKQLANLADVLEDTIRKKLSRVHKTSWIRIKRISHG